MAEFRRENQLSLVVYPNIYRVSYIPGGCFGISERISTPKILATVIYLDVPGS